MCWMNLLVLFLLCFIFRVSIIPALCYLYGAWFSIWHNISLTDFLKKNLKIPQESHQNLHPNHWGKNMENSKLAVPESSCQLLNLSELIKKRLCGSFRTGKEKEIKHSRDQFRFMKNRKEENCKPTELPLVWFKNKLPLKCFCLAFLPLSKTLWDCI